MGTMLTHSIHNMKKSIILSILLIVAFAVVYYYIKEKQRQEILRHIYETPVSEQEALRRIDSALRNGR